MQRSVSSTCPSPTTSSSPPLSRTSSYTDISIEISHSSDVLNAQYTVGVMQGSLDALQVCEIEWLQGWNVTNPWRWKDVLQNLTDQTLYPGLTENSKLSKELAEYACSVCLSERPLYNNGSEFAKVWRVLMWSMLMDRKKSAVRTLLARIARLFNLFLSSDGQTDEGTSYRWASRTRSVQLLAHLSLPKPIKWTRRLHSIWINWWRKRSKPTSKIQSPWTCSKMFKRARRS